MTDLDYTRDLFPAAALGGLGALFAYLGYSRLLDNGDRVGWWWFFCGLGLFGIVCFWWVGWRFGVRHALTDEPRLEWRRNGTSDEGIPSLHLAHGSIVEGTEGRDFTPRSRVQGGSGEEPAQARAEAKGLVTSASGRAASGYQCLRWRGVAQCSDSVACGCAAARRLLSRW